MFTPEEDIMRKYGLVPRMFTYGTRLMYDAYGRRVPNTEFHRKEKRKQIEEIRQRCKVWNDLPWYKKIFTRKPWGYKYYAKFSSEGGIKW